jgi:peptidoglycan/xylan/chitin deacetylase (PgdA/CDA1 family)
MQRNRHDVLNLCFHGIGEPQRTLEQDEELFWIDPKTFEGMLASIEQNPDVRITFDDGNASDVAIALPALLRHGLHARFFIIAGRCGSAGSLSAEDVRELARNGMTIGSHGMRHRPWRFLNEEALREELAEAASLLGAAAGQAVNEASCPLGSYDRRVLRALRKHGFSRVYTVDEGLANPDAWLQTRYTIRAGDTPERIAALARNPRGSFASSMIRSLKTATKRWR